MPRKKPQPLTFAYSDTERNCPICGKEFFINGEEWAYKRRDTPRGKQIWFCSWGCMRKYEKGEQGLKGRGARLNRRDRICQMLDDGLNDREIAQLLGITPTAVAYNRLKHWEPKEEREK